MATLPLSSPNYDDAATRAPMLLRCYNGKVRERLRSVLSRQ